MTVLLLMWNFFQRIQYLNLSFFQTPTLILHGNMDRNQPSSFLLSTPNHVFHSMEGGHSVYLDQTRKFNDIILNFLNYLTRKTDVSDVLSKC